MSTAVTPLNVTRFILNTKRRCGLLEFESSYAKADENTADCVYRYTVSSLTPIREKRTAKCRNSKLWPAVPL